MERNTMRKIGLQMSVLMGVSLSFCLSLSGNALSGHFTMKGFVISFAASTALSLLIGFAVPVKPLSDRICDALSLRPRSIPRSIAESLVSDFLYTPLITLLMVFLAWKSASVHGAQIPFAPMFLHSLVTSMIIGFVLILMLMPVFLRIVLKMNGIHPQDETQAH